MDAVGWITSAVAVYAAVVSTLVGYLQWRATKPNVRVSMNLCIIHPPVYGKNPLVTVSAGNGGGHPVTVTSAGWSLPNGMACIIPIPKSPQPFPHTIPPGNGHQIFVSTDDVQDSLVSEGLTGRVKIQPFYRDQVGRTHQGSMLVWDTRKRTFSPRNPIRRLFPKRVRVGGAPA